jgi:hypothetical protein
MGSRAAQHLTEGSSSLIFTNANILFITNAAICIYGFITGTNSCQFKPPSIVFHKYGLESAFWSKG